MALTKHDHGSSAQSYKVLLQENVKLEEQWFPLEGAVGNCINIWKVTLVVVVLIWFCWLNHEIQWLCSLTTCRVVDWIVSSQKIHSCLIPWCLWIWPLGNKVFRDITKLKCSHTGSGIQWLVSLSGEGALEKRRHARKKASWWWRQRLGWWRPPKLGRGEEVSILPWSLQRQFDPTDTLTSDCWPPQRWGNKVLLV